MIKLAALLEKNQVITGLIIGLVGIVVGVVGAYFGFLQASYAQQQLQRAPILRTTTNIGLSATDEQAITQASDQLVDEFYSQLYNYKLSNPQMSYHEAASAILPLSATVDSQPMLLSIGISNSGNSTATKVRISVNSDRNISTISVMAQEPYVVISGGIGKSNLTIEVDRIIASDTVNIAISFENAVAQNELDKLILEEVSADHPNMPLSTHGPLVDSYPGPAYAHFPRIRFVPAQQPFATVYVASNEGGSTQEVTINQ